MKVGVLGLLIVGAVGLGIVRTLAALDEGRAGTREQPFDPKWLAHLVVSEVAEPPEDVRGGGWICQPVDPPAFHLTKLAHFRWQDAVYNLDRLKPNTLPYPIHNKTLELGGTLIVPGAIEDELPGLPAGEGVINLDVYLVTTGPIEIASVKHHHPFLCAVINIDPGGAGAKQGLRNGDVLSAADGFDLLDYEGHTPCDSLTQRLGKAAGEKVNVTLFRGGKKLTLELTSPKERSFGVPLTQAVVLEADLGH